MGAKLEILTLRRSGKGVALSDDHMVMAVAACEDRLHVVIAALERRVLALEAVADPLSGFE
jgi:hypothetical protein